MVRSRFGVERCCCPSPEEECDCSCQCTEAFEVYDELEQPPLYRGNWFVDGMTMPPADWTFIYWTHECNATQEHGFGFHAYEDQPPERTSWRIWSQPFGTDPYQITGRQEFAVQIRNREPPNEIVIVLMAADVLYDNFPSGCKMKVGRYRVVLDPETGYRVPELGVDVFVPHQTGPQRYSGFASALDPPPTEDIEWNSWQIVKQMAFLGAEFPPGDPRYDPNFPEFSSCISNVQIWSEWLSDDTLWDLWNNGEGIPVDEVGNLGPLFDLYCAHDPPPVWQDVTGRLGKNLLQYWGPVWDDAGDAILDDGGDFIHAVGVGGA